MLESDDCPLPASSLYAIASLDLGMTYINFTPSLGATPKGIDQLAHERSTRHAGRDAKTGETLLKSVLGHGALLTLSKLFPVDVGVKR